MKLTIALLLIGNLCLIDALPKRKESNPLESNSNNNDLAATADVKQIGQVMEFKIDVPVAKINQPKENNQEMKDNSNSNIAEPEKGPSESKSGSGNNPKKRKSKKSRRNGSKRRSGRRGYSRRRSNKRRG
ncbi:Hypothetical predicted protein [Cloeon dipterum]|uniref:Uncharacterized protein n=1 Tax=Cloeon dipterum TaxID=197152 RepID=A0A8S1CJ17_9INSE|nr:Hypothetical predicted protein [Cloeon dipterum]